MVVLVLIFPPWSMWQHYPVISTLAMIHLTCCTLGETKPETRTKETERMRKERLECDIEASSQRLVVLLP